jgi:hypothetical protein
MTTAVDSLSFGLLPSDPRELLLPFSISEAMPIEPEQILREKTMPQM